MTANQLKKVQNERPFRPFTIFLSDQRSFAIEHPEFLWILPGDRTIGIADKDGAAQLIDLIHVTGLGIEQEHST